MKTPETVVLFEGIATIDVDGVAHDAYAKIYAEIIPAAVRWYGQFEWMGSKPENFVGGGFHDLVLSDGRECRIRVARFPEDGGSYLFRGADLPPGFELFVSEMVSTELESSTPILPLWRRLTATFLAAVAFVGYIAGVWDSDHRTQLLVSSVIVSLASMVMNTKTHPNPRQLKEVKSERHPDVPH